MEQKKKSEPGGYVTTSRWSLIWACVLLVGSVGMVWFFVAKFSPPAEEEPEDKPVARKKKAPPPPKPKMAAASVPAPKAEVKPEPKPKPRPAPKPKIVTRAFQDGVSPDNKYRGTRDTYLSQQNADGVFGRNNVLIVDGDEPGGSGKDAVVLFRWDLSSVPRESTIRAAKMTFHVADVSTHAYKIYRVTKPWVEERATWKRARNGNNWDRSGGDRDGKELGKVLGTGGSVTVELNAAGIAAVQEWIKDPGRNHGLMLAPDGSQTNGLDLRSRETGNAKQRPRLELTYAVTPGN